MSNPLDFSGFTPVETNVIRNNEGGSQADYQIRAKKLIDKETSEVSGVQFTMASDVYRELEVDRFGFKHFTHPELGVIVARVAPEHSVIIRPAGKTKETQTFSSSMLVKHLEEAGILTDADYDDKGNAFLDVEFLTKEPQTIAGTEAIGGVFKFKKGTGTVGVFPTKKEGTETAADTEGTAQPETTATYSNEPAASEEDVNLGY